MLSIPPRNIVHDFPKYKGKDKLTQRAIKHLTIGVRCVIKMHSITGDVEQLCKDLRNGPSHVFSDHTNCSTSFCKVAAGISNSSSQQVNHSGGVVATQVPALTSSSAQ